MTDESFSTSFRCNRLFGAVAPAQGWVPPIRYLLRRRRVLRLLRRTPPGALLEVGCGSGALLHDFAQGGHHVTGLETSAAAREMAISIARVGKGRQNVVAAPDPQWAGRFDIVCAFDVLEHIEDDGHALDQWMSWLRPGGQLCLSVPAHSSRWGAGDVWAGHYRRYDRESFKALLMDRGLLIQHFECYGFPLANLTEAMGNRTYRRLLGERERTLAKEEASSLSGIDRGEYMRLFQKMDSLAGRSLLRAAMAIQALASRTNLGSGYLTLARRP